MGHFLKTMKQSLTADVRTRVRTIVIFRLLDGLKRASGGYTPKSLDTVAKTGCVRTHVRSPVTAHDDVKTVGSRRVGGVNTFLGDHFSMRFRHLPLLCFVSPWLPLAHLIEDCCRKVARRDTRKRLFRGQAVCGTLGSGLHV